jgi:hypothetical protein
MPRFRHRPARSDSVGRACRHRERSRDDQGCAVCEQPPAVALLLAAAGHQNAQPREVSSVARRGSSLRKEPKGSEPRASRARDSACVVCGQARLSQQSVQRARGSAPVHRMHTRGRELSTAARPGGSLHCTSKLRVDSHLMNPADILALPPRARGGVIPARSAARSHSRCSPPNRT